MSGKQARRARQTARERDATPGPPDDMAYFAVHPDTSWRVRRTLPGEWELPEWPGEPVPKSTHLIVVYDRQTGVYRALPLDLPPGADDDAVYDAAVVELLRNPPPHWRVASYSVQRERDMSRVALLARCGIVVVP